MYKIRHQSRPAEAEIPEWSDRQAVFDLITREFTDEKCWAVTKGHEWFEKLPPEPMFLDFAARLKSNEVIYPSRERKELGVLLKAFIEAGQLQFKDSGERKRGPKSRAPELRKAMRGPSSLMPLAELICVAVIDYLKRCYPKQSMEQIKPVARAWTAAKFNKDYESNITATKLRNYMGHSNNDLRRFSERPKRSR
jgi:hypothetical protein